ncbi:hypothetical protein ScalyP_jg6725 [Parmales sp. scaly parma]|nr:hypothetical protein ScalyP_jg6725 [Parmales sp. scaly parma]
MMKLSATAALLSVASAYPGEEFLHPTIHFSHSAVANGGGWHDIAGAFTNKGKHHIFQGQGWNHAVSEDLVHWTEGGMGPKALNETYHGMQSTDTPCSGYVVRGDDDLVCAGFRQCGSNSGVDELPNDWDVPMEVRCAHDQENLTDFSEDPTDGLYDFIFPVSFWRGIPYDPARPWFDESTNMWYHLIAMDGCNSTDVPRNTPDGKVCPSGGALYMWSSPALRGAEADWQPLGNVFQDNTTVLKDYGFLSHEFVTIDFFGTMEGDPSPAKDTAFVFLNNVGGNGGGDGCCGGTTAYTILSQPGGPGTEFEYLEAGPGQQMVDWGSFKFRDTLENMKTWKVTDPTEYLDGSSTRGFSMARTLGSEESNQVTKEGRRVLIGWTGNPPFFDDYAGSLQSLPRELSLADDYQLKQKFVDELQTLRGEEKKGKVSVGTSAVEVLATFPSSCGEAGADCGLEVLADGDASLVLRLNYEDMGLITLDGTTLGNAELRAGPLPKELQGGGGWSVSVIVDHSIVEIIVNELTAFVLYVMPEESNAGEVRLWGGDGAEGEFTTWELQNANVAN